MAIIVQDSFTRANSTTTLGTTTETGHTWAALSGTWGIFSNQAYLPTGSECVATVNIAQSDLIRITATIKTIGSFARLVVRATDGINHILIQTNGANYRVYKVEADSWTTLADFAKTPAVNDIIAIELSGSLLKFFVNGVQIGSVTETFNQSATKHGIGAKDSVTRLDDFKIESLGAGTPGAVSYATKQIINRTASTAYATKQAINQTGSIAYATKQIINTVGLSAFATKQIISQVGSIAYATQQTITDGGSLGSVAYSTKQIISLTASLVVATRQSIYQAGSSEWATKQAISNFVTIESFIELLGEWEIYIELDGQQDTEPIELLGETIETIELSGEMEPLIIELNGGINVAVKNEDKSIYAGNSADFRETVRKPDGSVQDLSGATITWVLRRNSVTGTIAVTKTTPTGIAVSNPTSGVFTFSLSDSETDIQHGRYYHEAKVKDVTGKSKTVSEGFITIKPSGV